MIRIWYDKFKDWIFSLLEFLFSRKRNFGKRDSQKEFKKILIIQLQQLGDSLIFTPALRAIRKRYPSARIDLLVNSTSYDLYSKNQYINNFWILKTDRMISYKMAKLLWKIRKENYECSVLCATQIAFRYTLVSYFTGADKRVGLDWKGRGFLNTITAPFDESKFYIDLNLEIVRALGAEPDGKDLEIWHSDEDRRYIGGLLKDENIAGKGLLVCIHAGSNWQSRTWFPDRFAEVADFLVSDYNAQVIFSGRDKDKIIVDEIRAKMKRASISFVGKTDIRQLAALIERSGLFIGVDSGPQHIAVAVNTPSALVVSSACIRQFDRWRPLTDNQIVVVHETSCAGCFKAFCDTRECMELITVDEVKKAIRAMFERKRFKNAKMPMVE